jgi:hypothetical protein
MGDMLVKSGDWETARKIYVSEALHRAALSPYRRASTIATPSGASRQPAERLARAIKQVIAEATARTIDPGLYRSARFRVYDHEGKSCRRRRCGGVSRRRTQVGSPFVARRRASPERERLIPGRVRWRLPSNEWKRVPAP